MKINVKSIGTIKASKKTLEKLSCYIATAAVPSLVIGDKEAADRIATIAGDFANKIDQATDEPEEPEKLTISVEGLGEITATEKTIKEIENLLMFSAEAFRLQHYPVSYAVYRKMFNELYTKRINYNK